MGNRLKYLFNNLKLCAFLYSLSHSRFLLKITTYARLLFIISYNIYIQKIQYYILILENINLQNHLMYIPAGLDNGYINYVSDTENDSIQNQEGNNPQKRPLESDDEDPEENLPKHPKGDNSEKSSSKESSPQESSSKEASPQESSSKEGSVRWATESDMDEFWRNYDSSEENNQGEAPSEDAPRRRSSFLGSSEEELVERFRGDPEGLRTSYWKAQDVIADEARDDIARDPDESPTYRVVRDQLTDLTLWTYNRVADQLTREDPTGREYNIAGAASPTPPLAEDNSNSNDNSSSENINNNGGNAAENAAAENAAGSLPPVGNASSLGEGGNAGSSSRGGSDYQDSSDVVSDGNPMDFDDPTG
jgi:hypothetical protein